PVAALGDVAVARARPADGRALRIVGTVDAAARAVLGHVAGARRGATLGRARLEGVLGAVIAQPVAALRGVAVAGGGAAHVRALDVGGAVSSAARAVLGHVAGTRRGAALGRARLESIGRA